MVYFILESINRHILPIKSYKQMQAQPITINIRQQDLYAAATLGCLVLVLLALISSQKQKKISLAVISDIHA